MAKSKHDLDTDGLGIEPLDLDSIDELFEDPGSPRDRGPIRNFLGGAREGFRMGLSKRRAFKNFAMDALPEGYTRGAAAIRSGLDDIRTTAGELRRENAHSFQEVARRAEALLPKLEKRGPKRLHARLQQAHQNLMERLEADIRDGQSEQPSQAGDQSEMLAGLAALSGEEQAQQERHHQRTRAEEGVRDGLRQARFHANHDALLGIREGVQRQVAYQDQITHTFQRKSLELQYRSYYVLNEIKHALTKSHTTNQKAYQALVHNTALSDHEKSEAGEQLDKDNNRIRRGAQKAVRETLPNFLGAFFPSLRENTKQQLGEIIRNAEEAGGMGASAAEILGSGKRSNKMGRVAGLGLSQYAEHRLIPQLARRARPFIERQSERHGAQDKRISYWLDNAPAALQEFVQGTTDDVGWRGKLRDLLQNVVPSYAANDQVKDGSFQTIGKGAGFNQLTQRSIVEIIPGYLSRILHEARMLRTGDDSLEREVYDVAAGKFSGKGTAEKRLLNRMVTGREREGVQNALSDIQEQLDPGGSLSDSARQAIQSKLVRDANTNKRFDPNEYLQGQGFDNIDDRTLEEIQLHFQNIFSQNDDGLMAGNAEDLTRRDELSRWFLDLRNAMPQPEERIRQMAESGSMEILRELGLLEDDHGTNRINLRKLWGLYTQAGGEPDPQGGEGPTGPGSPSPWDNPPDGETWRAHARTLRDDITTQAKRAKTQGREMGAGLRDRAENLGRQARTATTSAYVRGESSPRITAGGLRSGAYFLAGEDTPIQSLEELDGRDVYHREIGIVLAGYETAELVTQDGTDLAKSLFKRGEDAFRQHTPDSVRRGWDTVRNHAKETADAAVHKAQQGVDAIRDAYVKGEALPRLKAAVLRQGGYFNQGDSHPLKSLRDLDGRAVVDRLGNVVVSPDEIRNLIDRSGSAIDGAQGRLKARAESVLERLTGRREQVTGLVRRGIDTLRETPAGRRVQDWVRGKLGKDEEEMLDGETPESETRQRRDDKANPFLAVFRDIRNLLRERLQVPPEERFRKNSWREKMHERAQAEEREEEYEQQAKVFKKAGVLGGLGGMGKALMERLGLTDGEGPYTDDEEGEGDDGDIYAGSFGGGDKEDKKKNKKNRNRGKPKGKLGKLWRYATGGSSKVGQGIRSTVGAAGKFGWGAGKLGLGALTGVFLGKGAGSFLGNQVKRTGRTTKMLGKGLLKTGGWGLKAAGLGATVLGGAAVSPVVGTALGVASTAYTAHQAYEWMQKRKNRYETRNDPLQQLRLLQYGIRPENSDEATKVIALERMLDKYIEFDGEDQPRLTIEEQAMGQIPALFGIDPSETEKLNPFATWFGQRFRPVFMAWQTALGKHAQDAELLELDTTIKHRTARRILETVVLPYTSEGPYDVMDSPFGAETSIDVSISEIKDAFDAAEAHYAEENAPSAEEAGKRSAMNAPGGRNTMNRHRQRQQEEKTQVSQTARDAALNVTRRRITQLARDSALAVSQGRDDRLGVTRTIKGDQGTERVTPLTRIRLHAYGLKELPYDDVSRFLNAEEHLFETLKKQGDGDDGIKVRYEADFADLQEEMERLLGIADDKRAQQVVYQWLRQRVLTVAMEYAALVWTHHPRAPLASAEEKFNDDQTLEVAQRLLDAHTPSMDGPGKSIWKVVTPYTEDLGGTFERADQEYRALKERLGRRRHQGQEAPQQDRLTNRSNRQAGAITSRALAAANKVAGPKSGQTFDAVRQQMRGLSSHRQDRIGTPMGTGQSLYQPGGELTARGRKVEGLTQGNGGKWEDIPLPDKDGSYQGARPTLKKAGKMSGVDPDLLATFVGIESGFEADAKASTSSATGWMQFIDSTWARVLQDHREKYGIPRNASRRDPRVSALMGAEFLKENAQTLKEKTGEKPTDTDLYLAHFLGVSGAIQMLAADQNALAADVNSSAARANQSLFYKAGGQARTVGEFYQLMDEKVDKHRYGDKQDVRNRASGERTNRESENNQQYVPTDVTTTSQDMDSIPLNQEARSAADQVNRQRRNRALTRTVDQLDIGLGGSGRLGGRQTTPTDTGHSAPMSGVDEELGGLSGGVDDDAVVAFQDAKRRENARIDARQRDIQARSSHSSQEVERLMERSVKVQEEMRDYLWDIAKAVKATNKGGDDNRPTETTADQNPRVANGGQTSQGRRSRNDPAPISMKR